MKKCSKCFTRKDRTNFSTSNTSKDGLHSWCNSCASEAAAVRYNSNIEKYRKISRESAAKCRLKNPGKARANKLRWNKANPDKKREMDRVAALKYSRVHPEKRRAARHQWKHNNRDLVRAHKRFYEAAKRGHQPDWADNDAIRKFYYECPAGFHVDHVLPLRGKVVSGLHIETNLQYLPAVENCRKGNRLTA